MVSKIKPWLYLPVSFSHKLGPVFLNWYSKFRPYQTLSWRPFVWNNIEFNNPLGTAGGLDKNAACLHSWWTMGPGFLEIGTITPRAQDPNPGTILARDNDTGALWNKMGFPNEGVEKALENLKSLYQPHFTPIFANIGKNRDTPNEKAADDYITCIHKLTPYIDVFVVNVSSPNTKGLRELLEPENLRSFLKPVLEANESASKDFQKKNEIEEGGPTPILLKLSPDITDDEVKQVIDISCELGIDGWIFSNTTTARDGVDFPEEGGVSGSPLAERSKKLLSIAVDHLGDRRKNKLIVSTGGVMSPEDVFERLEMGADLVQTYSALVFNGPFFFREVADKANAFGLS